MHPDAHLDLVFAVNGCFDDPLQPAQLTSGSGLCCSTRTETISAQNWPATGRFEGHSVGLATLIAGNLKSLTFAASSFLSAKVGPAGVSAGLAAFRMGQVSFLVVFLLAFGERKRVPTLRAGDLDVWHGCLHEWD
jgi:hypothetical protein